MNSFTPLFRSLVDSSLASEPDHVFKAFVMLLAIKDSDHVARITAFGLGRKCWPLEPNESEQRALDAIKVLSEPDTTRIEPQPFDGRRVEKQEDGYLVLNGQVYEDLMRKTSRKIYKARKEREYREKKGASNRMKPMSEFGRPLKGETKAVKDFGDGKVDKDFQPITNQIAEGTDL